jgi:hypothetical protein
MWDEQEKELSGSGLILAEVNTKNAVLSLEIMRRDDVFL